MKTKHRSVLNLVIESYLGLGKPVSSGYITRNKRLSASPATVRNIMAKLEAEGYLAQPHTSAGRVPTDKGLRFYVNSLLAEASLAQEDSGFITEEFPTQKGDFDSLLMQVSKMLAEHSDNLGFVISPRVSSIPIHHLRLMKISENKVMIVLVTPFQMALTEIVDARTPFTQLELDKASQYINQNFRGKTLIFVRDFLVQELPKYKLKYEDVLSKLIALVRAYILQEESAERIFLQGASRLLDKADLFRMDKLKSLFQNFEEKANLARLLSDFISLDRVKVLIGSEVNLPSASDCSLVLSHYGSDSHVLGSLGILGPKRIPYQKIIPLVDYVAKKLSRAISSQKNKEVTL